MGDQLLYLFSSNIRPLYVQDVLDVLAAPAGTVYRFRYEKKYVSPSAVGSWQNDGLKGTSVLVHFTLQQEARYHDPIFFPIRRGKVVRSSREGLAFFVEFRLEELVSLRAWSEVEESGRNGVSSRKRPAYEDPPKKYREHLWRSEIETPYDYPASLGKDVTRDPAVIDDQSDQEVLFERTVEYLSKTESFRNAWFVRFLRVFLQGAPDRALSATETGIFELSGGQTYEIQISQRQPRDVRFAETFTVATDADSLKVVGSSELDIGSRYDRLPIFIHTVEPAEGEPKEALVSVQPKNPASQAPRLRIPIRIKASAGQAAVGVATTFGLVLVAVLSQINNPNAWVVSLLIVGILLSQVAARMPWFVRSLGRVLHR